MAFVVFVVRSPYVSAGFIVYIVLIEFIIRDASTDHSPDESTNKDQVDAGEEETPAQSVSSQATAYLTGYVREKLLSIWARQREAQQLALRSLILRPPRSDLVIVILHVSPEVCPDCTTYCQRNSTMKTAEDANRLQPLLSPFPQLQSDLNSILGRPDEAST
jgi:hypothetical protein